MLIASAGARQPKKRKKRKVDNSPALGLDAAALDKVPSPHAHANGLERQTAVLKLVQQLFTVLFPALWLHMPITTTSLSTLLSWPPLKFPFQRLIPHALDPKSHPH